MRKPTNNPMQELAKWKEIHAKQQAETDKNATNSDKKGANRPNFHKAYAATMPQLNRQFALTNRATMLCKYRYPDDYHHKHQMAQECEQLRTDLKGGKHLLNDMLKPLGLTLTKEQRNTLKRFNLAVGYLNYHLKGVAQAVANIDGLTAEELAQLVAHNESKAQSGVADE